MLSVAKAMRKEGWPASVIALSGNGYHLLYRVDEPNDAETAELFKKCLAAIAERFATDEVEIDTKVFNAARIIKAYGSRAAKGVSTNERPHRFSKILAAPEKVRIVNRPQLEALASTLTSARKKPTENDRKPAPITPDVVEKFLTWGEVEHKPAAGTTDGGRKWILAVCPFNVEHTNSPAVFLSREGLPGFKCFHENTCGDKHWKQFREAVEEKKGERFSFMPQNASVPYESTAEGIIHHTDSRGGERLDKILTNFSACIVTNIEVDDGIETKNSLEIEAVLKGRTRRFCVPSSEFTSMAWAIEKLGGEAIIAAGMGSKDHARAAIQHLSENISHRLVFSHSGWRRLGNEWVYLHADGAIGRQGLDNSVSVKLAPELAPFRLPEPPACAKLRRAICASLRLLDVAAHRITIPLYAAIWRSVLGEADFGELLVGRTGVFKTALVALAQQHFGPGFDALHLPGSFNNTANANAALQFAMKDALFVVDDFLGQGSEPDLARAHRDADRIFRGQANRSGRARLARDGVTLKDSKPPRCLTLSTGETVPNGQSIQARIWLSDIAPGDVDVEALSACQQDAEAGLYAEAMSGFLKWLAPRLEERREWLQEYAVTLRHEATEKDGQHRRSSGQVANLHAAFELFLTFARESGAITRAQWLQMGRESWRALLREAARAATDQAEQEPCRWFLDVIRAVVLSGAALVGSPTTGLPREKDQHKGRPLIGWISPCKEFLLLEPEAAYAAAQELVSKQRRVLPFGPKTLWKRMDQGGYIAQREEGRNLARFVIGGARRRVVCVRKTDVFESGWDPADDD
jgi:hypothetical protein